MNTRVFRLRYVLPALALLVAAWVAGCAARAEEAQLRAEAHAILALFGKRLAPRWNEPAYRLSYANRRRLELARALALKPRLLLLDEPTAGMNPIAQRGYVLQNGHIVLEGPARGLLDNPEIQDAYLGEQKRDHTPLLEKG